jgi:hypothetical protein
MTTRRNVQMYARTTDRKMGATRDGLLRRSVQTQVFEGTVVGIWTVVADAPARDTKNVLVWTCNCDHGHVRRIANTDLSYGIAPARCAECAAEDQANATAKSADARRVLAELLTEQREQSRQQDEERK